MVCIADVHQQFVLSPREAREELERLKEVVDAIEGAWYVEYNRVHTDRFQWYDWEEGGEKLLPLEGQEGMKFLD